MEALLGGVLGLLAGVVVMLWLRRPSRRPVPAERTAGAVPAPARLASAVVDVLRAGAIVVDQSDNVVLTNAAARQMGLTRAGRVTDAQLRRLARITSADGEPREVELDLTGGRLGREPAAVRVRSARADQEGHVTLLVEDITEARRVEAVRRDFVANVSHELKTPVGALSLLAEAMRDASAEPAAVRRFAQRMQQEADRLGHLVRDLIDLSRLQGGEPLPAAEAVSVDRVVAEAVDRTRLAASACRVSVVTGGNRRVTVLGNEGQLVTALANLLANAINYSEQGTRVAVGVRRQDGWVEISVSDQGIGIAESDLERVFERFYRADPARSRATGGTGLGLAIVKHVASNHGGSVSVWSVEGSGSTFTLRLPTAEDARLPVPSGPADRTGSTRAADTQPTASEAEAVRKA